MKYLIRLEDTLKTYYEYERAKEEVAKAKEKLEEEKDKVKSVKENIEEICKLEMVKNGLLESEDVINDYTIFQVFFRREENGDLLLCIDHNVCMAMHERELKNPIYIEKNGLYKKNWLKKLKKACSDNKYWKEFLSY